VNVGGGLAGMSFAQYLECALPSQTEVIVLSAENHLAFSPMLSEVAGRTISPLRVVKAGRQATGRAEWLGCSDRSRIEFVLFWELAQRSEGRNYSVAVNGSN
jgi:hypothetical protein